MFAFYRNRQHAFLGVFVSAALFASAAQSQEAGIGDSTPAASMSDETTLRFSFQSTPWRDVIHWLAEESDLALHVSDLPTGSFTYSDPNPFTHQEALDRINLFLLPQGFTLVQSGRLLSVINLGDPRSMQQLDALARLITVDELDARKNHDVVKCIFPLGELKPEDAVQELSALNLMTAPAVFEKTKRLLVTDTVGKLKNVKAILDAFQPETMDNGTVVKSFALQHASAEDVLMVARPHLGLATGEMIGIDVSLSADLQGENIFVTGVEDKVKLIENLVMAIDRPQQDASAAVGATELRAHIVEGGNVELVYNVLQTLLAGKPVRLSMDETAGSIVALATPDVQTEIAQTVTQLQTTDADFEVIPLKWADPYFVISLLEQMLDLPDSLDDPDEIDPDAPRIDADPAKMRLFVRAKKHQIEQIKKIVAGLDVSSNAQSGGEIRVLPLKGGHAERLLVTAAKFWREPNPVIFYRSSDSMLPEETERVVNGRPAETDSTSARSSDVTLTASPTIWPSLDDATYLSGSPSNQAPPIRCELTSRGLLMQSADTAALDQFEEHLRAISGPLDSIASSPIVFYLKYTKADDAIRMLAELLDGGEAAQEADAGSLVNGFVSSGPGTFLSSMITSRDGTMTMMVGTVTVVADPRLNRLITQGSAGDIERIENYLKIIDKDRSLTSIETYGTSHVIELLHTNASEVAASIREAYASRVTAASGARGAAGQPGSPEQVKRDGAAERPSEQGDKESAKKAGKQAAAQPPRDLEPKMTIAVHEPSNSLIVTGPAQLVQEVEQLAKTIDARGEQTVEVITPVNGAAVEAMLRQVLLGETVQPNSSSRATAPPQSSSYSGSGSAAVQRSQAGR